MSGVQVSGLPHTKYTLPEIAGRKPSGDWLPAPHDLLTALNAASVFTTTFRNGLNTFTGCVHLIDGRVCATDNVAAVEIGLASHLPDAVFRPRDIRLLNATVKTNEDGKKVSYPPSRALLTSELIAFEWDDGSWVCLRKRGVPVVDGFDGAANRRVVLDLIDRFWTAAPELPSNVATEISRWAKIKGQIKNRVARVDRDGIEVSTEGGLILGIDIPMPTSRKSYWPPVALTKALQSAKTFDFDADPSLRPGSFSFENARGVMVQSSRRSAA